MNKQVCQNGTQLDSYSDPFHTPGSLTIRESRNDEVIYITNTPMI